MKPICVFFHGVFQIDGKLLPAALPIIREQMGALKSSGLLDAASEMRVGINGWDSDYDLAKSVLPEKANIIFHGERCRNECRTLVLLENWLHEHDDEWHVVYFHAKGSSKPLGDDMARRWRGCAMKHLVKNWRRCVADLEKVESVGVHFMQPPATPPTQYIWAGNAWWARSSFLKTLPSIYERERIKVSGIDALESRYESEVWIGNGPRPPTHIDYHPNWNPSKIRTCTA